MSAGLTSARIPESNGRAVISALKTLQAKIRAMESEKIIEHNSAKSSPRSVTHEIATNTPRLPLNYMENIEKPDSARSNDSNGFKRIIATKKYQSPPESTTGSFSHCLRPRSELYQNNLIRTEPSSRSKELEEELSQADQRCKLLEARLDQMREAFARSEIERNKQIENRIRSERESVARQYQSSLPDSQISSKLDQVNHSGNEDDMELEEVNLRFRNLSPRGSSTDRVLSNTGQGDGQTIRSNAKSINFKVRSNQTGRIPFCAARSTQPSHNVGLNIQGLLHQLKNKNQQSPMKRKESVGTATSSIATDVSTSTSSHRLHAEISNLKELLRELQNEFGDITLSCRENELDVELLQNRLQRLEKKGQQILVVKKLIKKKEDASRASSTISSKNKQNVKSSNSQKAAGIRPSQNRVLLREVRKMTNQFQ